MTVPNRDSSDPNASADVNDLQTQLSDVVSQAEAEAGVGTTGRRWTAERVNQAIQALAPSSGGDSGAFMGISFNLYTGDGIAYIDVPAGVTISKVLAKVETAPVGDDIDIMIRKNSKTTTDILSSDLVISAGTNSASSTSLDATNKVLAQGDRVYLAIKTVGSSTAGADLGVTLVF